MATPAATVVPTPATPSAAALGPKVIVGVRWNVLDQALQQGLRIGVSVTLARLLLPHDFGVAALAFVVSDLARVFGDIGLAPALVFVRTLRPAHVRTAVTSGLMVGLAMTALVASTAGAVASFFRQPDVRAVLLVMSTTFLMKGLVAPIQSLWRRDLTFKPFVLANAVAVFVAGAAAVLAAAAGARVWALVTYSLGESFVGLVVSYVIVLRAGRYRFGLGFERRAFHELASFGASVSGTRLVLYGRQNIDNVIVGHALGAAPLGYYDFAYTLMLYPIQRLSVVVSSVSFPAFSQLRGETRRLAAAYTRALRMTCVVAFPVTVASAAAAPLYVPVVFGSRWTPAVTTLQVLALNGVRLSMTTLNGTVMESTGRPQWNLALNLGLLAVAVPGFVVGVHFGIFGVALAFTAAGFMALPVSMTLAGRRLRLSMWAQVDAVRVPVLASAAMAAVMELLMFALHDHAAPTIRLVIVVSVAAGTYLAVVARLDRPLVRDAASSLGGRGRRKVVTDECS